MKQNVKRISSLLLTLVLCLGLLSGAALAAGSEEETSSGQAAVPKFGAYEGFSTMVLHYEHDDPAKALTVNATKSDEGTLSYQWYYNSVDSTKDGVLIPEATGNSYTPPTSAETEMRFYYCVVTNTLNGSTASNASRTQAVIVCPTPTVTVYFSLTDDADFAVSEDGSGEVMAFQKLTVPYFDLGLYGLEKYYFQSESYGPDPDHPDQPGSTLKAGSSAFAYGKITVLHMYIYALEHHYLGLEKDQCGKGYLYQQNFLGTDTLTIEGSAGSLYMRKFWGHDENLTYYHNYRYPLAAKGWGSTSDQILLHEGDMITTSMYTDWDFHTNKKAGYHHFAVDGDQTIVSKNVTLGESVELTLYRAWGDLSTGGATEGTLVTDGLPVYLVPENELYSGSVKEWETKLGSTDSEGKITVDTSGLKEGAYLVCVAGQAGQDTDAIVSCAGGIRLVVSKGTAPQPGDVNGDGVIDGMDAVAILRYVARLQSETFYSAAADVNGDGVIDGMDAVAILRKVAGLQD